MYFEYFYVYFKHYCLFVVTDDIINKIRNLCNVYNLNTYNWFMPTEEPKTWKIDSNDHWPTNSVPYTQKVQLNWITFISDKTLKVNIYLAFCSGSVCMITYTTKVSHQKLLLILHSWRGKINEYWLLYTIQNLHYTQSNKVVRLSNLTVADHFHFHFIFLPY